MAERIQKGSTNLSNGVNYPSAPINSKSTNTSSGDISVWLKDNGNGVFDREDIIDNTLRENSQFWIV